MYTILHRDTPTHTQPERSDVYTICTSTATHLLTKSVKRLAIFQSICVCSHTCFIENPSLKKLNKKSFCLSRSHSHFLSISYSIRSFNLTNFHFQIDLCILTSNVVSIYLIDLEIMHFWHYRAHAPEDLDMCFAQVVLFATKFAPVENSGRTSSENRNAQYSFLSYSFLNLNEHKKS